MGAGARAAAMGNAYTAVADDVTAGYWNPAGLSQISGSELSLMHNEGLVDTQYEYFGAATKMNKSAVAVNVYNMNYGSIDGYNNSNVKSGSFDASSLAGSLTYSSTIGENMNWGMNAKYIKETLETQNASAFAADFGFLYRAESYKVGATIQNLGPKMKFVREESALPQLISLGVARNFLAEKLLVAVDASKYNDNELTYHAGLDYNVASVMSLRTGFETTPSNQIDVNGLTGLSAGVGLHIGALTVDYAFRPFGDLGDTHRVSLLIKFNRLNK
jgi:long-subunit fatty acid transport protein